MRLVSPNSFRSWLLALSCGVVLGTGIVKREVSALHRASDGSVLERWEGTEPRDLHAEYNNIFRYGNRNAASHLWTTFLFDRAVFMTEQRLLHIASGYCAVSGSPVGPRDSTRYRMRLPHVDGSGKQEGFMYYCCWPCVCDTQDFIKVDTKTVQTAEGPLQLSVAVLGNPCDHAEELARPFVQPFDRRKTTILESAREVRCSPTGELIGATISDHGYVIISVFFNATGPLKSQDENHFEQACQDRADAGYNSGMGEIFRRTAAVTPIDIREQLAFTAPSEMRAAELRAEVNRRGIDDSGVVDKAELVRLLRNSQNDALSNLGIEQLRSAVVRQGLTPPPSGPGLKSQLVAIVERMLNSKSSVLSLAELSEMNAGQLREAAELRGLDTRGCYERADFVRLIGENEHPASADLDSVSDAGSVNDSCSEEKNVPPVDAASAVETNRAHASLGAETTAP